MVATRILFAAAFCLLRSGAVVDTKISVSPTGAILNNMEMELRMRRSRKSSERGAATGHSLMVSSPALASAKDLAKPTFMAVVADIQVAFAAVVGAVTQFEAGEIQQGIVAILNAGEALIAKYVPENVAAQLAEYTSLIEVAISRTPAIAADIKKFKTEADTEALARALIAILDEIEIIVAEFESDIDGLEAGSIVKYFEALEEVIRGSSLSWSAFTSKASRDDIVSAMENIYASIRSAVLKLVPEGDITQELQIALTVFDATIGNLTSVVQSFKQELALKVICFPRSLARIGKTPTVCPNGFTNEGSRCIAAVGGGADCWEACGGKAGACDSFCGAHTNGQKTVCCKEGADDACECQGATGFVVTNPANPANSYHQCAIAGPFVQAPSLLEANRTEFWWGQRRRSTKCTERTDRAAQALVEKSFEHKRGNGRPAPKGSTQAQCAPGEGELCEKKCVQGCPAGSEPNGCKCRAMCAGSHPVHQNIIGMDVCGADAMSLVTYATDAFMAGSALATLIDYQTREDSIKELSQTIQAGISLLKKLVIPQCEIPESMQSLLPPAPGASSGGSNNSGAGEPAAVGSANSGAGNQRDFAQA